MSFTGVTVNFTNNQAMAVLAGAAVLGGQGVGGLGGDGVFGGHGGSGIGGPGGRGGNGGFGVGGGIFNAANARLTIDPRLGAKKGSRQSKATNTITDNQANSGLGGAGGQGGDDVAGLGGRPNGLFGTAVPGTAGANGVSGIGIGGGLVYLTGGIAMIANTNITGNRASTADNDVSVAPPGVTNTSKPAGGMRVASNWPAKKNPP